MINLLPHREWALARQRQILIATLVGAALLGNAVAWGVSVWLSQHLERQSRLNSVLKTEIQAVDRQLQQIIQLEQELARLQVREATLTRLEDERHRPGAWLHELGQQVPDGLYLTALKQDGHAAVIQGVGRSSEPIFNLLRQLGSQAQWLTQPELIEVAATSPATLQLPGGMPFSLRAALRPTPPPQPPALTRSVPSAGASRAGP